MFPFGDSNMQIRGFEILPDRPQPRGNRGEMPILPMDEPLWLVKGREIRASRENEESTDDPPRSPKEEWAKKPPRVPQGDTPGHRAPRSPRAVSKKPVASDAKPKTKRPR